MTRGRFPRVHQHELQQEVARALAGKELADVWSSLGAEPGGQPPEEMARFVAAETAKWARVVKESGAKLD